MSETPSAMVPLGTPAPSFALPDTRNGKIVRFEDIEGPKGTLIMFICNHCPYVKHIREGLLEFTYNIENTSVGVAAISSNDAGSYPEDSPEKMKEVAREYGYNFPYLYDETQEVAKAFQATCTPDFFLYDKDRLLFYRGQFDDSRPSNDIPVTGDSLRCAIYAILSGKAPPDGQRPSLGCNIKWKSNKRMETQ